MSAANAAAIRRRVSTQNTTQVSAGNPINKQSTQPVQPAPKSVSLPQIINGLDKRIKYLESNLPDLNATNSVFSNDILDEFNSRFEILANELSDMKDTIMKLQSFTMEVNKSLYDERIQIFSDVDDNNNVKDTILDIESDNDDTYAIHEVAKHDITDDIQNELPEPDSEDIKKQVEEELSIAE
mgnify:FL=1|jgi:hypothetical protein